MKRLFFLPLLLICLATIAEPALENTIITEGKASLKIKPEIFCFSITVERKDLIYKSSVDKALSVIDSLKNSFRKIGINPELLKTTDYSVSEDRVYDPTTRESKFVGYVTRVSLVVKINYDDKLIDLLYNTINGNYKLPYSINFELSSDQMENAKKKLIELAMNDARLKASEIAKNGRLQLGGIVKVQYGNPTKINNFIRSNYEYTYDASNSISDFKSGGISRIATRITPNEIELSTNVIIGWQFYLSLF
ncbi:MAG TPA: SIMPL domain-containing protein [Paludibacter sp.]